MLLTLMFSQDWRQYEDDDVVDDSPKVEHFLHTRHDKLLDFLDLSCIILESKRFMFVMNERFPAPDREANLLPERDVMMMVIMVVSIENLCDHLDV